MQILISPTQIDLGGLFVYFMNKAFLLTLLWNNYTFYVDNSVEGEYTKHVSWLWIVSQIMWISSHKIDRSCHYYEYLDTNLWPIKQYLVICSNRSTSNFCFIICLMGLKMKSYIAGLYSVIVAIILAIFVYKMPATVAVASAGFGILSDFIQFVLLLSQQFSFTN